MPKRMRLILDLDALDDPVSGRLERSDDGSAREFHGYVGLIAAIEHVLSSVASGPAQSNELDVMPGLQGAGTQQGRDRDEIATTGRS